MTKASDSVNIKELQMYYNGSSTAKALLDHFASRERNRRETTVDRLYTKLTTDGVSLSRGDVIKVLQKLEDVGCGRFVAGRKGHPSRFKWIVGLGDVGRAAAGEKIEIEAAPTVETEEPEDPTENLIEHRYRLRRDVEITLKLPTDLSSQEASRLASFLQTLPFEDAKD